MIYIFSFYISWARVLFLLTGIISFYLLTFKHINIKSIIRLKGPSKNLEIDKKKRLRDPKAQNQVIMHPVFGQHDGFAMKGRPGRIAN